MEIPKNKLPEDMDTFITLLKNYINEPIYFFGSVNRIDYVPYKSDIDAAIFTNNLNNMSMLLQHFLKIEKDEIKKIIVKVNNTIIHGKKIHYKNKHEKIDIELVIYDIKYKEIMLEHYRVIESTPIFICYILLFLKYLQLYNVLPSFVYYKIKCFLFTFIVGFDNNILVFN